MKQLGKILKFELSHYLKNKAFIGITVFLVLLIAAVMCLPRIIGLFEGEDATDTSDARPIMIVKANESAQAELVSQSFAAAFTDYQIAITEESIENIQARITSGEAECAFVIF